MASIFKIEENQHESNGEQRERTACRKVGLVEARKDLRYNQW
jgi:hypothetical protein